jgi:predicted acetyltransferase
MWARYRVPSSSGLVVTWQSGRMVNAGNARNEITVRATEADETRVACDTMRAALLTGPISDDDWKKALVGWDPANHQSITAWDGEQCVGHAGAFRFQTVVPGGALLDTAGISRVGVLPTHTRMGLLSRMMHQLLAEQHAAGTVLASLRASEATIYGRFGYGLAGDGLSVSVDPRRVRPIVGAAHGSCRLLPRDEVLDVLPGLYARVATRPGMVLRNPFLWERYLASMIDGSKAEFVVVHSDPGGNDDGYAHYGLEWVQRPYEDSTGKGTLFDLVGATPGVELALWDFLTNIDLLRVIEAEERPVDDVLRRAAYDMRGYTVRQRYDEQWLRLLDVEAALRARTYRSGVVTVAITDPMFAKNNGAYRVADGEVTRLQADPDTADLRAGIDALSAAYLGSTSWTELCASGKAHALDDDAAGRADDVFAHRPTAWCGTFF